MSRRRVSAANCGAAAKFITRTHKNMKMQKSRTVGLLLCLFACSLFSGCADVDRDSLHYAAWYSCTYEHRVDECPLKVSKQ